MAIWIVEAETPGGAETLRFRIFPQGEPEHWVAETNPALALEVQEEFARLIAELLSRLLEA